MFELTVKGDIASAHFLPGYEGMCKDLHGHTWRVEVTIISETLDNIGMVADFKILKKQLKNVLDPIDHVCLNDLDYFKKINPTSENIAKYIYEHYREVIKPLELKNVRVWESETASVLYYE